jgi:hypothetical protein
MKMGDVALYLWVSGSKVRQFVGEGKLRGEVDPLDKRRKSVRVIDHERLKRASS